MSTMKRSGQKSKLLGSIAWVSFHANPRRTVMITTKKTCVQMIQQVGDEGFMIFWYASLVGWIICGEQGVEKTMKFASEYETNVADLHGLIRFPWTRLPQGMTIRRIFNGKLLAEDVVVIHRGREKLQFQ
jgi:hypothetical protein